MGEFIRTFIAIEPDEESKEKLTLFVDNLKNVIRGDLNWTKKENLHFTLKFLGEISKEKIEEVTNLLHNIANQSKSFYITISDIGFFPDIRRPRILWAGVKEGKDELIKIAQEIENDCEYIGFERERREFKAHLTLARIKDPHIKIDDKRLQNLSHTEICKFVVNKIILYKSELSPLGAKYSKICEFKLNA